MKRIETSVVIQIPTWVLIENFLLTQMLPLASSGFEKRVSEWPP